MDHKRLRALRGKCDAAISLIKQRAIPSSGADLIALEQIVELADIVAAPEGAAQESADNPRQLSLGEFIDLLEAYPEDKRAEDACYFDFGFLTPTGLDSYRGYYDQLAMGFAETETYPEPTVATVLKWCQEAVGKEYTGYKGGEFTMSRSTPLWVANYGKSGSTAIVGRVADVTHAFVIKTAYLD